MGKFYQALELSYYVTVADGMLNLEFVRCPGQNVARVCSLAVRPDPLGRASQGTKFGHNWPGFDYWKPSDSDTLFQVSSILLLCRLLILILLFFRFALAVARRSLR